MLVGLATWPIARDSREAFQLDGDGGGQCGDAEGGAAGVDTCKIFGMDSVVRGEVAVDIGEEHGDVDEVFKW